MTTIVVLAAFVMAASATHIQETSDITNGTLDDHTVPPPDVWSNQPLLDDLPPSATPSQDTSTTREDGSNHPTTHQPAVSSNQPANNDMVKPETKLSPPPLLPEESTGIPPDDDPDDCNITDLDKHIYRKCSFVCQLDEAVEVPNGKPCYLNYPDTGTEEPSPTGPRKNITGVCRDGLCVEKPDNVTDTTPESSTVSTTTTTDVTNTTPESSTSATTTTTDVETVPDSTPQSSPTGTTTTTGITGNTSLSTAPTTTTTTTTAKSSSPEIPTGSNESVREPETLPHTLQTGPNNTGPVATP